MSEQIVGVSVDKVQTFLTEVIRAHTQERQTEDATLKGIINASNQISGDFFKAVRSEFRMTEKDILLKCSGVCIFRSSLPQTQLETKLNKLFVKYYRTSQGQKILRWTYFPAAGHKSIEDIQRAKKELKKTANWNRIIEKNKELLFSFCDSEKEQRENYTKARESERFPEFAVDMNALGKGKVQNENHFRIAVIKADLNGMGAMFQNINCYEKYKEISEILNTEISLKGLSRAAGECAPPDQREWLFPLYIAGDDIFFAVAIENLTGGVDVCKQLMQNVNEKIKNTGQQLSISVGVGIAFNRQPIRYYMETVEAQLKHAKGQKIPDEIAPYARMKISIENQIFLDLDSGQMQDNKKRLLKYQDFPTWNSFLQELACLSEIRESEQGYGEVLGTSNFFYTLLEDLTEEQTQNNDVRYMNHVLYHLIPKYIESSDQNLRNMELNLIYNLISCMCKRKGKITCDTAAKKRLETHLRLMLLFSDTRFNIYNSRQKKRDVRVKKDTRRVVFGAARKALYEMCLRSKNKAMTDIFIGHKPEKNGKKEAYWTLSIEKSMFFRLRDVHSVPAEKAANIIELRNPSTEEERKKIEKKNEQRINEGKCPSRLYFNRKRFLTVCSKTGAWTSDFVDSLMLFYCYHSMFIKYPKEDRRKEEDRGKRNKSKNKGNF